MTTLATAGLLSILAGWNYMKSDNFRVEVFLAVAKKCLCALRIAAVRQSLRLFGRQR
ncbi:hypothetical protein JQ557_16235 [Bradyrhizobium sp. U87765 SZCCT0131]|uniref:hypothetical protein n=1 Tax=unclassified Bradyrhizobium TaxID=2631580 RepID=UPI001BA4D32E|nr:MULTISPECIES: hypothetical protein [unclassified Bradyrhizobium]MBR1219555.1 hypothetical protein [Bradyrhizobium sp. U87765 SZCCT0131]MBR1262206.1 hypothetical protein [Bradyrhizobium sp. U87765 SZCCT0134]MBR1308611.1 hypothetical protein [Bradyrhizobium sp. U87765 SZCCT0110]MBR1317988.1 hypothetical protein [Bradyrhizobium sp. U87765 SZCCT0109]MBR1351691.1 hypothetical protein [Bradyrhizobium sp. U87765 SZCCT0048]